MKIFLIKRIFAAGALSFVLFSVLVSTSQAQNAGDQGFGLMLGNPSGLSAKFWFDDRFALDGAVGVAQGEFDMHVSLLVHDYELMKRLGATSPNVDMPVYFGVGPRLLFEDNEEFGIRLPIGISFFPKQTPWEFFSEVAPVIRVTPDTGLDGDFAVGARYYFPAVRPK